MNSKIFLFAQDTYYIVLAVVLTIALFILDIFTPVGTATGILNVLPLLAALQIRKRNIFVVAPVALSIIAIIALFLKPGRAPVWIPTINRTFTIIALAVVSYSAYRRDKAVEALRTSERKNRELMENANSIIVRWDNRGTLLFMNDYGLRFFGYAWDEIKGRNIGILFPGSHLSVPVEDIVTHLDKYQQMESENILKNGERAWISWTNNPVDGTEGRIGEVQSIGNDITVLKRTERQLSLAVNEAETRAREAEERRRILEAIMINIPEGLTVAEAPKGVLLLASKMYANIVGIPIEKLTGMTIDERIATVKFLSRDTLQPIAKEDLPVSRALFTGEMTLDRELLVKRQDGTSITVISNAAPVRDASGRITHAVVSWRDITERKLIEETLRRSEYELRTLMKNTPDIVFRVDRSMRYVYVNAAYERMTGIRREEFTGKTNNELGMSGEQTDAWEATILSVFETGQEASFEFNFSGFFGKRFFRARVIPEFAKTGQVETIMVHARDISERMAELSAR